MKRPEIKKLTSQNELASVLEQAKEEQWAQLALIKDGVYPEALVAYFGWPSSRVFALDIKIEVPFSKLTEITSLTSLNFSGINTRGEGLASLASLSQLYSLKIGGLTNRESNQIGDDGAKTLANLSQLRSLDLFDNKIRDEGAKALANLRQLHTINLGTNLVGDEGAKALASLSQLRELHLGCNHVGLEGTKALAKLNHLQVLDLEHNRIGNKGVRVILDTWIDRTNNKQIHYLGLRYNGDSSSLLPAEVLDSCNAQAILAAYRAHRSAEASQTLRPLNEVKLLVVGNEAVGKTSLIHYLVDGKSRDPNEQKTVGTAIHEKIETKTWMTDASEIVMNVWDFGGQEIMRETHRYFLTKRSLYLLVLEARREDDRSVYEWLRIIQSRGGDSPVIVVINKCDDPTRDLFLNESDLHEKYPNLVGFIRTTCEPGERPAAMIAKLRQLIVETLVGNERLKHLHDTIPESWLRVKDAVTEQASKENVLEMRRFQQLCEDGPEQKTITDPNEQWALLRLLNDLGTIVAHGLSRDAPAVRREITLLDPNWLTGAIYTLLNSPTILKDQGGEFSRCQLGELLDPDRYPPQRHEFILDMMQESDIGLCFKLPDSTPENERYLMPEALSANEPEYENAWLENPLRFRYQYDYLPPGLIPRFIVEAHRHLTDDSTRWRTGVVLDVRGCPVLVRGDVSQRHIDIVIAGQAELQRSALNVVLDDLETAHRLSGDIGAEPRVPLPDQPKLDVSYTHLLKLEQRYGLAREFDPEGADRPYTVGELLEGVRRERPFYRDKDGPLERGHVYNNCTFNDIENDMSKTYKTKTKIGDMKESSVNLNIGENINQVTAEKIKNSFNRASKATGISDELKKLLMDLSQEVARIAEKLPDDQARKDVASDLETLTEEAIRPEPRCRWWELSLEGIKDAAKAVGEVGKTALYLAPSIATILAASPVG